MAARIFLTLVTIASVATAAPAESRQSCAMFWSQCGGQNWNGPTCCAPGSTCVLKDAYYSQCLPGTQTTTSQQPPTTPAPPGGGQGNPFVGVTLWPNAYYASEVSNLAIPSLTGPMATAAAAVAKVPSFMWLDTFAKTPLMADTLKDIRAANAKGGTYAGQFVVYNLPDRDCAAAASNGEYSIVNGGVAKYKNYIDTIKNIVTSYSDVKIILVIEPDSLANLVTNLSEPKCKSAQAAYLECIKYTITKLNLPNVSMYLDAGHAGWLGWPANQDPTAKLFAQVYKDAGSPASVRGLATNVANYNAWDISSPPPYTNGAQVFSEKLFVHALAPLLASYGWPSARFITDQGRSGKQPTGQQQWGDWCNSKGTGFGIRPSANTGDALLDAFVWVKPGGESDGTSNGGATRYDYHCGASAALQAAPEAGAWFQAYFVQLLTNANPSFV